MLFWGGIIDGLRELECAGYAPGACGGGGGGGGGDGVAVVRCQLNAGHNFDVRPWARVLIHDFTLAHPKPAAAAGARAAAAQVRATHWKPARSVRPLTPAEER